MRIKLDGTDVIISLWDILAELSADQKRALAEHLIWDNDIFNDLVECLATDRVVTESFSGNIHTARLRLMELLPIMQQNIIRTLLWEKKAAQEEKERISRWAWELYHAWPKDGLNQRPLIEDFRSTVMPTDQEVEKVKP